MIQPVVGPLSDVLRQRAGITSRTLRCYAVPGDVRPHMTTRYPDARYPGETCYGPGLHHPCVVAGDEWIASACGEWYYLAERVGLRRGTHPGIVLDWCEEHGRVCDISDLRSCLARQDLEMLD